MQENEDCDRGNIRVFFPQIDPNNGIEYRYFFFQSKMCWNPCRELLTIRHYYCSILLYYRIMIETNIGV